MKIIIATGNNHKKSEIKGVLGENFSLFTMKEVGINIEIIEDGITFEDNALIKARALRNHTKEIIIADDSGLSVEALSGQPGVYSARYAGETATDEENNAKLLDELSKVPDKKRNATFVCVIAMIMPNGQEYVFRGECKGFIGFQYQGNGGFGYDPLFIVDGTEQTFAQMSTLDKNTISHRAKALAKLKEALKNM
ncbi:XTP/dITP diphosphatase [Alkalibaculum sp. M08DMB]|uniref:dITP/XTP pyrophosphatase n=1 Tax=Alkalibaculum sporogenes TaxID=2655001 RepID=A0A6A7K6X5_9FIRM|nr:XTP/dITP diphosphatase [Alkalibaculum sporogenes]MPW24927.1 XTP/dITP diphosphatase [Alkalibaculum sporogenes]